MPHRARRFAFGIRLPALAAAFWLAAAAPSGGGSAQPAPVAVHEWGVGLHYHDRAGEPIRIVPRPVFPLPAFTENAVTHENRRVNTGMG